MNRTFSFPSLVLALSLIAALIVTLSLNTTATARDIPAAQGNEALQMEGDVSLFDVMGMEHCDDGDEECMKRRLISEAHLDYIYTQHHKP